MQQLRDFAFIHRLIVIMKNTTPTCPLAERGCACTDEEILGQWMAPANPMLADLLSKFQFRHVI